MTTCVKARSVRVVCVAVLGVVLASTVSPAAGDPPAQAVFYELTENMKLKAKKIAHRVATSALAGSSVIGTPFCPSAVAQAFNPRATGCELTTVGSDDVSLATGLGTLKAQVAIVVQGDNPFDGPELVVDTIKVKGTMDFSPALLGGQFFGTVKGFADSETTPGKEKFIGVFRLPFIGNVEYPYAPGYTFRQALCPDTLTPNLNMSIDFAYVETAYGKLTGRCIDVLPNELSLGLPLVRFDIWFTQ